MLRRADICFLLGLGVLSLAGCTATQNTMKTAAAVPKRTVGAVSHGLAKPAGQVRDLALYPLEKFQGGKGSYQVTATAGEVSRNGFCWPVCGNVSRGFKRGHDGLDICAPIGTPIAAAKGGKVIYSGNGLSGYGNVVVVEQGDGQFAIYGHNSKNLVRENESVARGQTIALVGETGNATTPHCHFEIRRVNQPLDPRPLLP